jgi:3-methyladenine DNA glycosylase AlkD
MTTADVAALADGIERELRAAGSPERARHEKRYVKSDLEHFGTSVPAIRRAAVRLRREHPELDRATLVALVEALWTRGIHECRGAAVELLDLHPGLLGARDAALLERLLRESRTWALLDSLAASVVGPFLERFPQAAARLDRWAKDPDFWMRRAALLVHLVPLREGRGDFARFARLADPMLEDREFFVRKAIGWVLRDASRADPARVSAWLLPRAHRAAGLTVREGVKYLAPRERQRILSAHSRRASA